MSTASDYQGNSKCVICVVHLVCESVISTGVQHNEAAVSTDHCPSGNKHRFSGLQTYQGKDSALSV